MIKLGMLGTLSLTDANGREVRTVLRQPRRLALLAYLAAATPRGFHHRDGLLALFWPELDQEHARAALRQALHVVRDALGADVIVTRGDEEVGLDFERLWCDVVAFDCAMAAGHLHEALEHYRGDLLNGFFIAGAGEFERWLESKRGHLREAAARSARALVEQSEAAGDLAAAAKWARRGTGLAPHDEELLGRLITLLDRLGDRGGARTGDRGADGVGEFGPQRTHAGCTSARTPAWASRVMARCNRRRRRGARVLHRRRLARAAVAQARHRPRAGAGRAAAREPLRRHPALVVR